MTWLFSLYWLGAFAIAGPVLFHMWRRTPKGERSFSTLMFLTPSPPRITSRSRVEHWLLLLLRAAALALLAFAFTRPLWRVPTKEPDESSNEQLVAIVVDTSASMRRDGIWEQVIRQLDERLANLPPQSLAALYSFDRSFVPISSFTELKGMEPSARRELLRAQLKELKPTWEATQLGEALVRAATTLQEAQTERAKPAKLRIWLASDLQSGAETIALQGYEWPDDLGVELIQMKPLSPSNAGIQIVERNPESGDDQLRIRVTNSADSLKEQFKLRWDTVTSPEVAVYVPPGQSRIIVPPKLPPETTASSLVLSGDDNDFDNRVFVAESLPEAKLVIYCGPESDRDPHGARFYLNRLFSASHRFKIEMRDPMNPSNLAADVRPSLLVMTSAESAIQPMIRDHLMNGGTVLIVSDTPESMLESLHICGRDNFTVTEASVSKYAMLGEIDFEHPFFLPFAESQFSDFTGIRFWKHRTIAAIRDSDSQQTDRVAVPSQSSDHILARFDDGDPAIIQMASGRGKIVVFASGWQPDDSQFARSSKFPLLIFRILENSTGTAFQMENRVVGGSVPWPPMTDLQPSATGSVRLPDGRQLTGLSMDHAFEKIDVPGIYTMSMPGRSVQVAVNLAPDESRTAAMTVEQLEGLGLKVKSREHHDDDQRQRDRKRQLQLIELEQSQKLWQQVMFVAIAVLLLETYLSGWFTKRNAE